jgi:outer membrane lipopolysaccharide assembly protein LptE/RlpB
VRHQDVESPPSLKEAQVEVRDSISENDKGILGKSQEKEMILSEAKSLRVCKRYTTLSTPLVVTLALLSVTSHFP